MNGFETINFEEAVASCMVLGPVVYDVKHFLLHFIYLKIQLRCILWMTSFEDASTMSIYIICVRLRTFLEQKIVKLPAVHE
jgi:hypothetical protein